MDVMWSSSPKRALTRARRSVGRNASGKRPNMSHIASKDPSSRSDGGRGRRERQTGEPREATLLVDCPDAKGVVAASAT